jgi:3-oxoacyl-[acyl-carrier protein] reductase
MKGRVALVTGAARGIGRAVALELAAHGADIAVNDYVLEKEAHELAKQIETQGNRAGVYLADVSRKEQVREMVSNIKEKFGRIDILINNVGISPKHKGVKKPVYEMDPEEWEKVIQVNLNGAFYCTRYIAPLMMEKRWGRIVNVNSLAGKIYSGPVPGAHYSASKAGMLGLTRASAAELAPFNILVNGVAPYRIETTMMKEAGDEVNRELLRAIPLGKFGRPEDVAKVVRFLASDENRYVVGATIDINGGRAIL